MHSFGGDIVIDVLLLKTAGFSLTWKTWKTPGIVSTWKTPGKILEFYGRPGIFDTISRFTWVLT